MGFPTLIIADGNSMTDEQAKAAVAQIQAAPADAVIAVDIETIPGPSTAIAFPDCPHGFEKDPLTGGHITAGGTGWFRIENCPPPPRQTKCDHGVYIPADEPGPISPYCSACNPDANLDSVHSAAMLRRKPPTRAYVEPETMDAADYMRQPVGERIATVAEWA